MQTIHNTQTSQLLIIYYHNMNIPISTLAGLPMGSGFVPGGKDGSNLPNLGFSKIVATRAETPPTRCTAPEPAMSTTPRLRRKPVKY